MDKVRPGTGREGSLGYVRREASQVHTPHKKAGEGMREQVRPASVAHVQKGTPEPNLRPIALQGKLCQKSARPGTRG